MRRLIRQPLVLALFCGLLMPLAFAPFGWWPLAVVSLGGLFALIEPAEIRRSALRGFVFGVGMFGAGVWWIQVSVHQFGLPYYVFSVSMTALFVLGMSLYPALFAAAAACFNAPRVAMITAFPALWTVLEYLRGTLFSGFPWLSLGYAQIESPLAGFAPLLGVFGVSLVSAVLAAALVIALRGTRRVRVLCITLAALVFACGYLLQSVSWTHATGKPKQAALVQGAIPQELKWRRELREPTIRLYRSLSEPFWEADLIIWPETAIPAFPQDVSGALADLSQHADSKPADLLIGMPTGDRFGGGYFNSVVRIGGDGSKYDKRHLVPFGEYFPFKAIYEGLAAALSIPMSDFSAGSAEQHSIAVGGGIAGISICYEDAFGQEIIDALPAADYLVNVSNDAWFGDTIAPHQHLEIARMRALESGRWLLRGTNTGITAIIDHRGRLAARAQPFVETVLAGRFETRAGATPFVSWGNMPMIGLCIGLLAVALVATRGQLLKHKHGEESGERE